MFSIYQFSYRNPKKFLALQIVKCKYAICIYEFSKLFFLSRVTYKWGVQQLMTNINKMIIIIVKKFIIITNTITIIIKTRIAC